jgi:hypothetical protein
MYITPIIWKITAPFLRCSRVNKSSGNKGSLCVMLDMEPGKKQKRIVNIIRKSEGNKKEIAEKVFFQEI